MATMKRDDDHDVGRRRERKGGDMDMKSQVTERAMRSRGPEPQANWGLKEWQHLGAATMRVERAQNSDDERNKMGAMGGQ